MFGLEDRVVVVAGAGGGGIGTAVCRLLGQAGARVAALDIDAERLQIAADALEKTGSPHLTAICDVCDSDSVASAVDQAAEELGPLYGLVHVAGGLFAHQWQATRSVPLSVVEEVFRLNLYSSLLTSQAVANRLLAQGSPGSLVFTSSVAGLGAAPFSAAYSAAKAGLLSLMRTEAVEWGPYGIRVNAVAPGSIRTPKSLRAGGTTDDAPEERDAIPLGRRGKPDEIAGAALFFLSDLAAFVSGQVLAVDGASSVKPSYLDPAGIPVFVKNADMRARLLGDG
jgi:3-oxoacyl-[acyl-carrier protein] reductase